MTALHSRPIIKISTTLFEIIIIIIIIIINDGKMICQDKICYQHDEKYLFQEDISHTFQIWGLFHTVNI